MTPITATALIVGIPLIAILVYPALPEIHSFLENIDFSKFLNKD